MANNVSASFPEYWSRRMQMKHEKSDIFRSIVSFEEQATLAKGDTVHRPSRSSFVVNDLASDGGYTRQDITDTDESLVINKEKEVSFYIREIDEIQSNYKTANEYADDAAVKLGNQIDGDVLGEYASADSTVDDGDLGGTAGAGITLTASNIQKVFGRAARKLNALNIAQDGRFAVISPEFFDTLWEYIGGKETVLGDNTGMNGHMGKFNGFTLHMSNNLSWTGKLLMGTNPSEGDTVTINGVVFTFNATPSGAGSINIGSNVAESIDNLIACATSTGTVNTDYIALSAASLNLLKNITLTDGATYITVVAKGVSYLVVSETLTAAADVWTPTLQIQHQLFGRKGAIDLVIQKRPNMRIKDRDGKLGKDIVSWTVYGLKTFDEGDAELVDVQVRSDAY